MNSGEPFDAIVIGSGFGGAVTACRLSEAGLNICILERGRRYASADLPVLPAETFWQRTDGDRAERKLPDFTRAFWQLGQGLWEFRDLGDLLVGQAAGFGGGSLIYANVHLRAPDEVFERWPAAYDGKKLKDYYELAAYMLDVQPAPSHLPKTIGLEAAAKRLEDEAKRKREQAAKERGEEGDEREFTRVFRPPLAVNFGREGTNRFGVKQGTCDMRGECLFGCVKQAKNTLDLNYLHLAEEAGAEVRTLAEVFAIELTHGSPRYQVHYRNHLKRGGDETVQSDYVFLCAGSVNTTELLLRSRDAKCLPVKGAGLGTKFHPNVDELAVIFDCKEEQETDRGPTITTSWLYDDGKKDGTWLMVQDGGLPAHLEPLLGMFRSPLWLQRNAFAKPGNGGDIGPAKPKLQHAALSQRAGYAALPVDSIVDLLTGLTRSAIGSSLPLSHDVTRSFLNFARGGRSPVPNNKATLWSLCPQQLYAALDRMRETTLADLAILAEPMVESFINGTAEKMPDGLIASIREMGVSSFDIGNRSEGELRKWALQAGVQGIWGSQAGLLGAIAGVLSPLLAPAPKEILQRVASLLRWALDYRAGDGHTTVLLSFGRDSKPGRLELVADEIPVGSRIRGKDSLASGILVHESKHVFVLSQVEGTFKVGEPVFAGSRPIGICRAEKSHELQLGSATGVNSKSQEDEAASASLRVLFVEPVDAEEDLRRFRTDSYREGKGRWESARVACKAEAQLRARLPAAHETPERSTQERLLRDIAQKLGGELRTSPLVPFLDQRITVHAQGGCPMAEDAQDGVTKPSGEVFGCDGLYVMDAAAFPSPVGVNPSATITAVAEWKVEQFIQQWLELPNHTAKKVAQGKKWGEGRRKEMEKASEWAEKIRPKLDLDPVGTLRKKPLPASTPPNQKPIGIEFDEVMIGTHRRWMAPGGPDSDSGSECAIETHLTATIDDLAVFLAADREGAARELRASGNVLIGWENPPEIARQALAQRPQREPNVPLTSYPVDAETSRIWLRSATDDCGNETRSIEYRLDFKVDGQRYRLDGIKDIRDDARFDVWEDTTTLCFLLYKNDDRVPCRWGVLRLPAAKFFGLQVPSLKATNINDDPARQVWAITTFARFFFSHLVDVYVPALDRVADVGQRVLGRGHA